MWRRHPSWRPALSLRISSAAPVLTPPALWNYAVRDLNRYCPAFFRGGGSGAARPRVGAAHPSRNPGGHVKQWNGDELFRLEIRAIWNKWPDCVRVEHRPPERLQRRIPFDQHRRGRRLNLLWRAAGRFRGGRVRHMAIGKRCSSSVALREAAPCNICKRAKGDYCLQRPRGEQCRKPTISISGHCRVVDVRCRAALIVQAVKEGIDHDVAAVDAELCQEPLHSVTGDTDQDTADDSLALSGILADAQYSCGAVQSPAVKYRPPLDAESAVRISGLVRCLLAEGHERLDADPGVESSRHSAVPELDARADHNGPHPNIIQY